MGRGNDGKRQRWEGATMGRGNDGKRQRWEEATMGRGNDGKRQSRLEMRPGGSAPPGSSKEDKRTGPNGRSLKLPLSKSRRAKPMAYTPHDSAVSR